MKTIKESLMERMLFIGEEIPESLTKDARRKTIFLGTPHDIIEEVGGNLKDKTKHEIVCWIAEYAYKKANPNGEFNEPPSMVYEMVARDFSKFLSSN